MSRTLANYTGVKVPDLTDNQPDASGLISGGVGGDFVQAMDDHTHEPGKGLPVQFIPTADFDFQGFNIFNIGLITQENVSLGDFSRRSIGWINGVLNVENSLGRITPLTNTSVVMNLTDGADYFGGFSSALVPGGLTSNVSVRLITNPSSQYGVDLHLITGQWVTGFEITAKRLGAGVGSDDFEIRFAELDKDGVADTTLGTILGSSYTASPGGPDVVVGVITAFQINADKRYRISVISNPGFTGGIHLFSGRLISG